MRTSCLLVVALGGAMISLSTPGCGGKLTNAETLEELQRDGAVTTGSPTGTGGSDNTGGTGGDDSGGSGGSGGTGGGSGGSTGSDPNGSGGTTGSGGSTTGGVGGNSGGSGGAGATGGSGGFGGGATVDASSECPSTAPNDNSTCTQPVVCSYDATTCACMMSGRGGGRRDAGTSMTWNCTTDAGRGGRS